MAAAPKPVDIDLFAGVAGRITILGTEYDVLDLNAEEYRLLRGIDDGQLRIEGACAIVARIVPTLPEEQLVRLTARQLGAIVAVADGRVPEVEALFPNGAGPADATTPSPAPDSP